MKSGDGAEKFTQDVSNGKLNQFLLKCLLFTILEPQNHIRSFIGSNGVNYMNKLTLDTTNGETLASRDIVELEINEDERNLIGQWEKVLKDAKSTGEYNPSINYGLYQIKSELNITYEDPTTAKMLYRYPSLNGNIRTLASMLKEYYNKEIVPVLFEYEFLK